MKGNLMLLDVDESEIGIGDAGESGLGVTGCW